MTDTDNWEGKQERECGEHRTCGYRAWCFDCSEWCSETAPCIRCEVPELRAELDRARPVIDAAEDWADSTAFCRCENAEGAPLLDAVAAYDWQNEQ
jgi:hypothetical protein